MLEQITNEIRCSEQYLKLYDKIGAKYGCKTKTGDYMITTNGLKLMTDEERDIFFNYPPLRWIEKYQYYMEKRIPWIAPEKPVNAKNK